MEAPDVMKLYIHIVTDQKAPSPLFGFVQPSTRAETLEPKHSHGQGSAEDPLDVDVDEEMAP